MDQYYVRSRGKILGPYDLERIKVMRQRGRIGRAEEVSTDKRNWLPYSQYSELNESDKGAPGGKPAAEGAPRGSAVSESISSARTDSANSGTQWFFQQRGKESGPVAFKVLQAMARGGTLEKESLVWQQGSPDRVAARSVGGLFDNAAFTDKDGVNDRDPEMPITERRNFRSPIVIIVAIVGLILLASGIFFYIRSSNQGGGVKGSQASPAIQQDEVIRPQLPKANRPTKRAK